ncbi:ubiquinol-cytochrome c reductase complex assembly factor 6 isoform X2 [Rhinolophus sinicus]|uniref:ubiquinol-cytochrome c reductase complex assembly factor 6 isoform X2 n=2 Tax=Rhinolophus sinicus TaxID=89399 RepID=UPI003D7A809F
MNDTGLGGGVTPFLRCRHVSRLGLVVSWEPFNTARFPFPSSPPTMPAGVSWTTYLKMVTASLLAMFAGAQVVHRYYRPDLTIPDIPPKRGELKTELLGLKERQHKPQVSQQ